MGKNKKLTKAIRDRMGRTGETFSTARMHVRTKLDGPPTGSSAGGGSTAHPDPFKIIEPLLGDVGAGLAWSDEMVTSATAATNAFGFGMDTYELLAADFTDPDTADEIAFTAAFDLSGDQDPDKLWCGTSLRVRVEGIAWDLGGKWEVSEAKAVEVESDF